MNAVLGHLDGELMHGGDEFFAPMSADLVDGLVGEYRSARRRIEALADAVHGDNVRGVLHYFIDGNVSDQRHTLPRAVEQLFGLAGAIGQLNADFWNRALRLTDVLDYMPQKRRDEWYDQIRNPLGRKESQRGGEQALAPLPEFDEEVVRSTLNGLLHSRAQFFAERVDGMFRALSREHVTNCPQGFNKRMILLRAISSYGTIESSTAGVINDLRCVIAKFMGRDEPKYGATNAVISTARKDNGQWLNVDGGALRIRIYNGVGTAHLEVHPDMAWRLNAVLASLYPAAIPSEFRTKPKRTKPIKDFELFDRLLPFAVIEVLSNMKPGYTRLENPGFRENKFRDIPRTLAFGIGDDRAVRAEAEKVLAALGGARDKEGNLEIWRFDYEPGQVLAEVICSGRIPDQRAYQFYPTPATVAEKAIELAMDGAREGMSWLEPSAGQGGLADLMPKGTMCVEISELHCAILEAKGHMVKQADFLALPVNGPFDRIVMNPPFSDGRWQAHLQHAASMVATGGGLLVAILPATAKGKRVLDDFDLEWSQVFDNEFAGTSVSVVILTAMRQIPF